MNTTTRSFLAFSILLIGSPALAAPVADLVLTRSAPVGVSVYQTGRYSMTVRNVGNRTADDVSLNIQLPATHTSPYVYVMGDLGAFDSRCTRTGTRLQCALGSLGRNKSTSVSFDVSLPYSTAPLVISGEATTTSAEPNRSNNSVSHTAGLLTYPVAITPPTAVTNSHCTGTNLSSYFECELFPSSISAHDTILNPGGTITFVGVPATYTGSWSQPSPDRLQFQYFDGGALVATFDGRGVSNDCFEGATLFQGSAYMSMYQVCLQ